MADLDQPQRSEADMPVLADDNMIVNGDAQRLRRVDDRLGHLDIGARGRRISRRMVVDEPFSSCYPIEKEHIFTILLAVRARCLGAVLCAPA